MSAPLAAAAKINRISPVRFIVGFGVVSALADMVYEGARSIIGLLVPLIRHTDRRASARGH